MRGILAALALTTALLPLPGGGAQAAREGVGGLGLHLVPMDEVIVPIIEADRIAGKMRFKLVLDAATAEGANDAIRRMPELRQATVSAGLEFARLNASGMRAVDAGRLDNDLNAALKAVEPDLSRVLIVEVSANR